MCAAVELEGESRDVLPNLDTLYEWIKDRKGKNPVAPWVLEMLQILLENEPNDVTTTQRSSTCYTILRSLRGFRAHESIPAPNSYVHYERMKNIPSNFIATGDAVMCLNPRFGYACVFVSYI